MHSRIIAIAAFCLPCLPSTGRAAPCVTLGDSLTFAYEAEFGFEVTVPFGPTYGDGFGPEVRNWVEILRDPAYRGADFDFGARDEFELDFFFYSYDLLFRHQYNWALPGLRIYELRDFMEASLTFRDLVEADPDLSLLLDLSDINLDTAFELTDLEDQIRDTAERLVFFIGGNDVRGVYGDIYQGASPDAFIVSFIDDATAILDRVQFLNPDLPVVVVNVPHIGITPDIKNSYPTDPAGTGRVTAALSELNRQLKALADARGYGYADVFTPTLPMLGDAPYAIHGIPFLNAGSTSGNLDYVWLNGEYSANFHPNTNGQAIIANEIIDAFNTRYGHGIPPLTATEILGG
ncbi:MAG TPA: SGNH/GDSL hydrolase family protein, partial [Luteolibacter sp.]|nr:SGNH/GDSL hydrolase family protein [Luteolibacter sp.]